MFYASDRMVNISLKKRSEATHMKTMLAVMIKILLFPMALMLRIISGAALAVIKVSSLIAGPLFILFGILAVFCLLRQEWMNHTSWNRGRCLGFVFCRRLFMRCC